MISHTTKGRVQTSFRLCNVPFGYFPLWREVPIADHCTETQNIQENLIRHINLAVRETSVSLRVKVQSLAFPPRQQVFRSAF